MSKDHSGQKKLSAAPVQFAERCEPSGCQLMYVIHQPGHRDSMAESSADHSPREGGGERVSIRGWVSYGRSR